MTKATETKTAQIATAKADIAQRIVSRRERDAQLVASARKRSDKYLAFFAGDRFAEMTVDYGLNLDDLFSRCDKTLDRFRVIADHVLRGDMTLRSARDQSRYTFDLVRSCIGAHKMKAHMSKTDVLATATKRDDASEFVTVSRRLMSDTTAERQSGIATYVLELLGVVTRVRNESGSVQMTCNTKSKAFKRFEAMIKKDAKTA